MAFAIALSRNCHTQGPRNVDPGCHGLGNHPMSSPFQKTLNGKSEFEKIVASKNRVENQHELERSLFDLMCTKGQLRL